MPYYKVLCDCGHLGIKRSICVPRYILAMNCIDAFLIVSAMPRVKRKRNKSGVVRVVEITNNAYFIGKLEEAKNPYLSMGKRGRELKEA